MGHQANSGCKETCRMQPQSSATRLPTVDYGWFGRPGKASNHIIQLGTSSISQALAFVPPRSPPNTPPITEHATNHDWSRKKKHPPKLRTSIVLDAHPVGMAQDQRRGGPVGGNGVLCCFGWGLSSSNSNQLRRFVPIQEVRPGRSMWNLKTTGLWRKLVFQGVFSGSMWSLPLVDTKSSARDVASWVAQPSKVVASVPKCSEGYFALHAHMGPKTFTAK